MLTVNFVDIKSGIPPGNKDIAPWALIILKVSTLLILGSDIILLVYDLSATFDDNGLTYWLSEIDNYAQHQNVILIGNKKDLTRTSKYSSSIMEETDAKMESK